ncbi:MAG TPA: carboxymuconolactone decarboxylase family protein [Chloroflexota bacterium]|nr:carboxymuconolactone decarboxylase family protein [Chloroflexota bacterium]
MSEQARVPLIGPETAPPPVRAAYAEVARKRGGVGHLWQAMAHSPELTRRVGAVGEYLRYDAVLPPRLREAVTLAVAGRWGCAYERAQHEPLAARQGLSPAAIAALAAGQIPDALDATEAAAVRYALALARDGTVDEALLAPLQAALGPQGVVELTVLVGYYSLLALFLNALAVPRESV